ncbi:MAG: hypothetical protein NVS2B8_02980 [Vulcanimicrobiaceae bacterium]
MIVTISRAYGAAGLVVADGTATALGYDLLTDDLPKTVAARLGTSPAEVTARASQPQSLSERILGGLGVGTPESVSPAATPLPGDFDESMRREIERTIRERAAAGNIVILGRNAGSVLAGRTDLVRVFLTGSRAWRIARLVEAFGQTPGEAEADIERVDAARRAFAKSRYKIVFGDVRYYDLTLDVSRFGVPAAIELVVAAVRVAERDRT